MRTAKRKGTANERRSVAYLEARGYKCTRAAASLGVFDVIGVGPADVVLVQVKSNRRPGTAEMEAIRQFKVPPACRRVVHVWKDGEAEPIITAL